MIDERNFRSSYYEKVGFRSVEEKKSLEMLLRDRPFDKAKLKQFCLRFTVPAMYRTLVWKILFGIIPIYEESHDFVMKQRTQEYHDLKEALRNAKVADNTTKQHQMFVMMWLLRSRRAKIDMTLQLETQMLKAMCRLAESLWSISETEIEGKMVDMYWILSGFLDQVQKFNCEIERLRECMSSMLEKEDKELHNHLTSIECLQILPLESWFYSCFAGTISDCSIIKIWDKISVGAYRILVFVAIVMLTTTRRCILRCNSADRVLEVINNITEETSEVIVNKAIESWQQSGSVSLYSQNPTPYTINT
ncbi:TBC1 domain family member 7 [Copidosoma floridanum]|uniref:TBC1 domain family member 7 n=1 Tax=Copidosoma floridanum TaxID=29053 RepID=UPI0006C96390|nr:TBC1 domain family member 7 [Copidosoma floridanum]